MTQIRELYKQLSSGELTDQAFDDLCFKGLTIQEQELMKQQGYHLYEGKVRQCLTKKPEMLVVHTDRLSAFDSFIGYVPFKGLILSAVSEYWFQHIEGQIPHHYVNSINSRTLRVRSCTPVKAEIVVRGYLAGSMMRAYQDGRREFCGENLPDNLKPYGRLPEPILTPTTKAEAFEHDLETSPSEMIRRGIVTENEWNLIKQMSLRLFEIGRRVFAEKGWILVDTKYEFGRNLNGEIILIDEFHTPDSSRLWEEKSYRSRMENGQDPNMLDKENVRRWLMTQGFKGQGQPPEVPRKLLIELAEIYLNVAERLIGSPLQAAGDNILNV